MFFAFFKTLKNTAGVAGYQMRAVDGDYFDKTFAADQAGAAVTTRLTVKSSLSEPTPPEKIDLR